MFEIIACCSVSSQFVSLVKHFVSTFLNNGTWYNSTLYLNRALGPHQCPTFFPHYSINPYDLPPNLSNTLDLSTNTLNLPSSMYICQMSL